MKNLKSYIEEGLLRGMDKTLASGQDDLDTAMDLKTLPKVKDFKKNPYNKDWVEAAWYCPNVLDRYRHMYPDMIERDFNSIHIILDKYNERTVHVDLWFADCVDVVCRKKAVQGWTDGFTAPLAKCKSIAIYMIKHIAQHPEKMDKIMAYAHECFKFYAARNNDYSYKLQKSIMDLKYEKI